jgi:hypothetical protein
VDSGKSKKYQAGVLRLLRIPVLDVSRGMELLGYIKN